MAISRPLTIGQNAEAFTASTITLTTSVTVPPGAKVFCFVGWGFSTATLSSAADNAASPLTWRVDRQIANGNIHLGLIEADAPKGLPSGTVITATFSAATPDAREIGGCYSTGVREGASFNGTTDTTGTTAWTSGSLSPAIGRLFIGGCYGGNTASPTSTPGGNNQEIHDFANASFSAMTSAWHISASTASQTVAGTWSVSAGGNASLGSVFIPAEDGWAPARPVLFMLQKPRLRVPRLGYPLLDVPFPALGGTTFPQALDANATSTATIQIQANKNVSATATSTATIVKQVNKIISATATSTASIVKRVGKNVTATVTSTASILAQKVKMQALTATVTSTATIVKLVSHPMSATVTSTASIIKQVNKALTATATSTASLLGIKVILRTITANVTSSATMVRQVGKPLSATATVTAQIVKQVGKRLSATATSTASLVAMKVILKALTATVTSTATMTRRVSLNVTATVTAAATVVKRISKSVTATVSTVASIVANIVAPPSATVPGDVIVSEAIVPVLTVLPRVGDDVSIVTSANGNASVTAPTNAHVTGTSSEGVVLTISDT